MPDSLGVIAQSAKYKAISNRNKSLDVSKLDVGFGGFTPMPLNESSATRAQVESVEARLRKRREDFDRAQAIEDARASELRAFVDGLGVTWDYVVLDGAFVRVEKCSNAQGKILVPESIEGLPVRVLAADACSGLDDVTSIVVPDSVSVIGGCAFRSCKRLESAVLPHELTTFESDWFRGCPSLAILRMPGLLKEVGPSLFDIPNLEYVEFGVALSKVEPGTFQKSKLARIAIDPDNPWLQTDGMAIYSSDAATFVALACPCSSYSVAPTCTTLSRKAFSSFGELAEVELPSCIKTIEPYALSRTGVRTFDAPPALEELGERAFFFCKSLEAVTLNEGLRVIGPDAFSNTAIKELRIPRTAREIGYPIAAKTGLIYSGAEATLTMEPGSDMLVLDDSGALYEKAAGGLRLLRLFDGEAKRFTAAAGTSEVAEGAFSGHTMLEEVILPEGVRVVGASAFKGCRALRCVIFPEGLQELGAEALMDTALESIHIPASLTKIGENALVTYNAHNGKRSPTLHEVTVGEGNARYEAKGGMLLEKWSNGQARVVVNTDVEECVRIPEEVVAIAPYAFNGDRHIRELYLSDRIKLVGMRGLAVQCFIEHIHIDLEEPIDGHASFDIRFPEVDRSVKQIELAFSVPDHVSVEAIFDHYDGSIVSGSSYDAMEDGGIGIYDQGKMIIARLKDPVLMTSSNKSMCDRVMRNNLIDIVVAAARHDDRQIVDDLLDLGYLTRDNIDIAVERAGDVQDAAMTGYLLEVKRRFFGRQLLDFDL